MKPILLTKQAIEHYKKLEEMKKQKDIKVFEKKKS